MTIRKNNIRIHGLHKSGSMFLYKFFKHLSNKLSYELYSANNSPDNTPSYTADLQNVIYCPFRKFDIILTDHPTIVQLRNPLDILVSQYYSFGFTHAVSKDEKGNWPGQKYRSHIQSMGIDEYCLSEIESLTKRYEELYKFTDSENVKLVSYFNMVYAYPLWASDILDFLNIKDESIKNSLIKKFQGEFENFKEITNQDIIGGKVKSHKRSIYAGDFARQLKPETISQLSEAFKSILATNNSLKFNESFAKYENKSYQRLSELKVKNDQIVSNQNSTQKTKAQNRFNTVATEVIRFCGNLDNANILDIGGDLSGNFVNALLEKNPNISHVTVVNPGIVEEKVFEKYSFKKGNSQKLEFKDNSFDFIISTFAVEHFYKFEIVLDELFRVLKPGGVLFTKFGPLWSSQLGHHLWIRHNNDLYTFQNTVLPAYCHLLMSREELTAWSKAKFNNDEVLANKITEFVYDSDEQNHLFYSDYEKIVDNSKFEKLFFMGHKEFPTNPQALNGKTYLEVLSQLKKQYPDKYGYGYVSISMLLSK